MKECDLTMPEIRYLMAECNFTNDESELFTLRTKDVPLEQCAEQMNVSIKTIDRMHKRIKDKIARVICSKT